MGVHPSKFTTGTWKRWKGSEVESPPDFEHDIQMQCCFRAPNSCRFHQKSLEAQEGQTYERKQKLREALASGKQLPTELTKDTTGLGKDLAFDEAQAGRFSVPLRVPAYRHATEPTTHIDNEYARAPQRIRS
jgi:hypothetical protein